jgi:hypothetical protein
MPPQISPVTNRLIRIEDIDGGVKNWFDKVLDLNVTSPQGDRHKVVVKFASGERWVAATDRQGIRDRDGRLILPVIQIIRTGVDPLNNMTALGSNVPKMQLAKLVSKKTSNLANSDSSRPISDRRLRDAAIYDVYSIPFPSNNNLTYKVKVQTQYQTHMNELIEKMLTKLEFFNVPSFIISLSNDTKPHGIKSGDGSSELESEEHSEYDARNPVNDYYVVGYIDGAIGTEGNLEEFTDQERIIQLQFTFKVPSVLMLNPDGERPAVRVERTTFGITDMEEEVIIIENKEQADLIFGQEK